MLTPVWPDRDDFIHVNQENIEEKMKPNFEKRPYGDAEFGVKEASIRDIVPTMSILHKSFEKRVFNSFFLFQEFNFCL